MRRDPGPAGRRLLAWLALTSASPARWRSQIERAAEALDVPHDEALLAAIEAAAACADGNRLRPFAAARCHQLALRALAAAGGAGELLAAGLADAVLALKLKWPFALPLLGAGRRTLVSAMPLGAPRRRAASVGAARVSAMRGRAKPSCSVTRAPPRRLTISARISRGARKNWPRPRQAARQRRRRRAAGAAR